MKRRWVVFPSGLEGKVVVIVFLGLTLFFWVLYFGGLWMAQERMGQGLAEGLDSLLSWWRWGRVLAGLGFAGVLALAWFAIHRMSTPMKRLTSAAQVLARGGLETPIPTTGLGDAETLAQALALGLGTVMVGAFDDEEVSRILGLEKDARPLYIMPLGRPR